MGDYRGQNGDQYKDKTNQEIILGIKNLSEEKISKVSCITKYNIDRGNIALMNPCTTKSPTVTLYSNTSWKIKLRNNSGFPNPKAANFFFYQN